MRKLGHLAGRDSSTAQADSFTGAKEEEKHRLAALRNDHWVLWRDDLMVLRLQEKVEK